MEPAAVDLAAAAALDAWLRRQVTTYAHICGTCEMSPETDPLAVVDQYGKVHGLEGVLFTIACPIVLAGLTL